MKCRRNYEKIEDGEISRSIMFFGSRGRDELGHAYFVKNHADHRYYLITCVIINVPNIPSAKEMEFDCGYTANGTDIYYKFGEPGNESPKTLSEIKALIPNLHVVKNINELVDEFKNINRQDNYSSDQESIKDSLIQRLSVLKRELWYKRSYGLPLMDKIKSKGFIDIVVLQIISSHPGVTNIVSFESNLYLNRIYSCSFKVTTEFTTEAMYDQLKIQL